MKTDKRKNKMLKELSPLLPKEQIEKMQTWEDKYITQIYRMKFPSEKRRGNWAKNRKKHYSL